MSIPFVSATASRAAGDTIEAALVHGLQRPLRDRERWVGDDQLGIDDPLEAEPVAALAAAVRRVEGEDPRLQLGHRGAAFQASEALAEEACGRSRVPLPRAAVTADRSSVSDLDQAVGELGGGLDRLRQALSHPLLHHQPIDDDRDVVLELLVELDPLVEAAQLAVDPRPRIALGAHLLQQPPVLALAPRTTGAMTMKRVPSSRVSTRSVICSSDWPGIGAPQL